MYQMSVSMDNQQNIAKLKNIPDCDILVLPEMWNCPYHNDALKTAYLRHDESVEALKKPLEQIKYGSLQVPFVQTNTIVVTY